MQGKLYVVVGGQFGSEGKGAVAGRLAADLENRSHTVVGVRVGGPNAGHTVLGHCPADCDEQDHQPTGTHPCGRHPWRLRQVPVSAVTAPLSDLVIAEGSEIDPDVLVHEVRQLDSAGYKVTERLLIDATTTVIEPHHRQAERLVLRDRIGSTAKGIGAARSARTLREAHLWGKVHSQYDLGCTYGTARMLDGQLRSPNGAVVIEGTQGYGLGQHAGYYPFCTSGDCRATDFLAQAGVGLWPWRGSRIRVLVCMRPYPIRVAGSSGPLKGETSWETLGLPQELTTVTQKVRRVGRWDAELAAEAFKANGAPSDSVLLAATMFDQIESEVAGSNATGSSIFPRLDVLSYTARFKLARMAQDCLDSTVAYVGTGPDTAMVDERIYE